MFGNFYNDKITITQAKIKHIKDVWATTRMVPSGKHTSCKFWIFCRINIWAHNQHRGVSVEFKLSEYVTFMPKGVSTHCMLGFNPPINRNTDRCKNITLPQTSFAGGKYTPLAYDRILKQILCGRKWFCEDGVNRDMCRPYAIRPRPTPVLPMTWW